MATVTTLDERNAPGYRWLGLAVWSAAVLVYAVVLGTQARLPAAQAVISASVNLYTLALLAWAAGRFVERRTGWNHPVRAVALHAGAGVVAIALWSVVEITYARIMLGPDMFTVLANTWMFSLVSAITTYCAAVGIGATVQAIERQRAQQQREAALELSARQSELAATRAQLQPHFLLNSLNSVVALIDDDPGEARAMVLRLSALLTSIFERFDLSAVPLGRELDLIETYLGIEQIRFGSRLRFSIDASPNVRDIPVPPFLLQPIVENAVKHGIEPFTRAGRIDISARLDGARLCITVTDSGDGVDATTLPVTGRGVDLTTRRLDALYGAAAALTCRRVAGGFAVTLDMPVGAHE